jgi:hypothetical protein
MKINITLSKEILKLELPFQKTKDFSKQKHSEDVLKGRV